ncbi:hypothetical protein KW412_02455 [Vibrio fluvialis]|nr:hypothetical protein [Vibrio fluvialis]
MKRNLLVAAAITAILSGCGGDEGGSSPVQLTDDPAKDKITLNPIVSQNDPNAIQQKSFKKAKWQAQKEDSFIRNAYEQEGRVTSVGTLPSELVDAPALVAPKYTEQTPSLDVKFVETPQKIAQGTPDAPLISGESRKVRKLPSAKPSVVDVNVPVATVTTIADPSQAVQLTIVPSEDQMTLTDNDFVVSQNDPDAIQKKNFTKAKWDAQNGDSFLLNGYPQEGWVTSVGTLPSELVDAPAFVAPKYTEQIPSLDVKLVETPQKIAQGTPDAPLISGESRKVRKLPSVKPSVVDVNVPVATVTTIADPSEAVQLTIVPPEDQLTLTDNDFVVSQNDPDAIQEKNFTKAKWDAQNGDSFILNGYPQEGWVTSVGTLPSELVDAPALVAPKYTEQTPSLDVKFVETPQKIAQGTPDAPLISGESRKVRKLPSAKPSVVDVNVPVATVTTIADPSEAVQLTIVPPEDQMTLTDNDFVVSQNDPDAIQKKNFTKVKWDAQNGDSFILNGYPQEGWVTSVGTLPSEMATLALTLKTTNDVAPAQNIEFGETPVAISQGEPELITYEETFTGSIEVAPEDYSIPVETGDEAPTYLTPEIVKQQAAKLDSVCLTNTQQFVQSSGGTLNTFGGSGNNFQEIKTDLTSDEDKISYSMEIFAMLQQALADNPDLQQAIAQQHAGGNKNSHVKATWTLSMNTGASYTLSTDSSQAYQPSIEIVVSNQGAVVINDGNGIELARIVSNAQNGDCENASYDVVIANN